MVALAIYSILGPQSANFEVNDTLLARLGIWEITSVIAEAPTEW